MEELFKIDFSNINIVATTGLAGTKFLGATPRGNFVKVRTKSNEIKSFEFGKMEK